MILKQGHTYRAMPHDGKLIAYIYRGGRCYYIASPYSPEATQALKAAFPQYWTAIRDYGYAHPQLVPFINEDPMLIVSLVEVGKTRWLVGDGKAYIDTGYYPSYEDRILLTTIIEQIGPSWQGCRQYPIGYEYAIGNNSSSNKMFFGFGTKDVYLDTFSYWNIAATYEIDKDGAYINGSMVQQWSTTSIESARPFLLFARDDSYTNGLTINKQNSNMKFSVKRNGVFIHDLAPYLHPTEGAGMLDIVSLTFHPNANTQGAFTIAITDKE